MSTHHNPGGTEMSNRGEAFKTLDLHTGKQIYPTILDSGLEGLADALSRLIPTSDVMASDEDIAHYDGIARAVRWLRGADQ